MDEVELFKSKAGALHNALHEVTTLLSNLDKEVERIQNERKSLDVMFSHEKSKYSSFVDSAVKEKEELEKIKKKTLLELESKNKEAHDLFELSKNKLEECEAKLSSAKNLEKLWSEKNAEVENIKSEISKKREKVMQVIQSF